MTYVFHRVMLGLLTIAIVSIFVFVLLRLLPGDAALLRLQSSGTVSEAQIAAIREQLGIDKGPFEQFRIWVVALAHLDFGRSFVTDGSALTQLRRHLPITLELVLVAWTLSIVIGVTLGSIAAAAQGTVIDYISRMISIIGLSIPDFLGGTFFILVASLWFNWAAPPIYASLFSDPITNLQQFLPPALILGFILAGSIGRLTRSGLLEVFRQDYIRTARAKGLSNTWVLLRHAMPNGLLPVVTISGAQMGRLLGGSVVLETVFGLPGVGTWLVTALNYRDYPVVQLGTLFVAVVVVGMNLVTDLMVARLDPRIRY